MRSKTTLVLFSIIEVIFSRENECQSKLKDEDGKYKLTFHCCENYEDNHGMCVECSIGYTTKFGQPCKECPVNRYGRRCALRCKSCKDNQRCDKMIGCVDEQPTTVFEGTSMESTRRNAALFTDATELYTIKDVSKQSKIPNNDSTNKEGASKREVVSYSVSAIGLFLVIMSYIICALYRRQNGNMPCCKIKNMPVELPDSENIEAHRRNEMELISIYDEIDDIDLLQQHVISSNLVPFKEKILCNSSDEEIVSETNSYLHPYQPLEEGEDAHGYCKARGIYSVDEQMTVDISVYHSAQKENTLPDCSPYLTVIDSVDIGSSAYDISAQEKYVLESESREHGAEYLEICTESELKQDDVCIATEITKKDDKKDSPEEKE